MIVQHLSNSVEHPTPPAVVEAARKVLGSIDLDPASSAAMNKHIRAKKWIGLPKDGLTAMWRGKVFLNPPGGRAPDAARAAWSSASNAVCWWRKLVSEYKMKRVTEAIFIGFNLEVLQASQGTLYPDVLRFPFCVPAKRLHFQGDAPTHGNVIVYLGSRPVRFQALFSSFGTVRL